MNRTIAILLVLVARPVYGEEAKLPQDTSELHRICAEWLPNSNDAPRVCFVALNMERAARKPAVRTDDDETLKARVALSYIDCDGDFTVRNGRLGLYIDGRFVSDNISGTYLGAVRVWGGEEMRYTLVFDDDLSHATLGAASGGTSRAKCAPRLASP
ncbi:hypothetical protein CQ14_25965 [Bradyrhizobium lablabi]|uniref:Uncharacterized protein n=1 Tax=Bradyrhizobium lablabi TaxID=722472 RepID=A0A0R3MJR9_9BRAD|nr:hypothetical protein [Bradyrhizobium lablabi]KRR17587.1 hypothetical protein CQ14_25965 [Bradyrhizobium lablabi]